MNFMWDRLQPANNFAATDVGWGWLTLLAGTGRIMKWHLRSMQIVAASSSNFVQVLERDPISAAFIANSDIMTAMIPASGSSPGFDSDTVLDFSPDGFILPDVPAAGVGSNFNLTLFGSGGMVSGFILSTLEWQFDFPYNALLNPYFQP